MKNILPVAVLLLTVIGCRPGQEKEQVMVKSEFAPLKKVVLAQSQIIFPKTFDPDILKILPPGKRDSVALVAGRDFGEVMPEMQKRWEAERENLKKVLERYGVVVVRPRLLTDYEKSLGAEDGVSNFFARDPFFTIGNFIIEGSLRYKHRRNEILPLRHIIEEEASRSGAVYVSVPRPDISDGPDSEAGPFLEGGDILVLDKTVFVGNSGQASNIKGYEWLKNLLGHYGYEVIRVPLKNNVLHLDCALSLVRNGLMIVSEDAFPEGIPAKLKDWDKIQVPASDIARLAVNGLPINETTYILDPEFAYIGRQLEAKGIRTEYVDFKISRSFGGSFRCSTQPFFRAE
jgi:N-dimethylarginine dimethylaminohydrolase